MKSPGWMWMPGDFDFGPATGLVRSGAAHARPVSHGVAVHRAPMRLRTRFRVSRSGEGWQSQKNCRRFYAERARVFGYSRIRP